MKLSYSYDKYLITINKRLSKDEFLKMSGAGQGYSLVFFKRIYDCIFSELIDAEEEYSKYYSIEYKTIQQYFFKKYNLSINNIEKLLDIINVDPNNTIYRKEDSHLWLEHFIFSDTLYEKIINILLMGTYKNEN